FAGGGHGGGNGGLPTEHTEYTEESDSEFRVFCVFRGQKGFGLLVLLVEGGVEGDVAAGEVEFANEGGGLGGAVDAVHADVLPFHGERALVSCVVECDDDVLKLHVAAADGAEVPGAAGVAEGGVTAEDADVAVAVAPPDVLHVGVEDA